MRQIIGLILQTIGYLILSWNVMLNSARKFINFSWEQKPKEIKLFLFFLGIKNNEGYNKLFSEDTFPSPTNFDIKQRIAIDTPLIAAIFIILGVLLNFN